MHKSLNGEFMFKSTFKLILNNFSMVWKILLYKIIVAICLIGLTTVFCLPIIRALINENYFAFLQENLSGMFLNFNLSSLVSIMQAIIQRFYEIVTNANLLVLSIVSQVVFVIVYYYVDRLSYLAIVDDVHSFMSSNLKLGFLNCYVTNFGKSCKLGLLKLVTNFLFDIIIWGGTAMIYYLLSKNVVALAPLLALCFGLLAFSLKTSLLAGLETSLIVNNCSLIQAIKNNFKAISKKFVSIFSNVLIISILLLFLNMFAVFFTFGGALLITIPLSTLTLLTFKNVAYYECTGTRYYADSQTIMMPKKLEEQDKFKKVRDII